MFITVSKCLLYFMFYYVNLFLSFLLIFLFTFESFPRSSFQAPIDYQKPFFRIYERLYQIVYFPPITIGAISKIECDTGSF